MELTAWRRLHLGGQWAQQLQAGRRATGAQSSSSALGSTGPLEYLKRGETMKNKGIGGCCVAQRYIT